MTEPIHWRWRIAACILAFLVIWSRRPDVFMNPQFYGEDGRIWFAQAYNLGWFKVLLRGQEGGYCNLISRLAASIALIFPLRLAPLVMNLVGVSAQILPVLILLSSRASVLGSLRLRACLALAYIALPNCAELNVTAEDAQWHLALAAYLLLVCTAPSGIWQALDAVFFVIFGLTGPFVILLLPFAVVLWWGRKSVAALRAAVILGGVAAFQLSVLWFNWEQRSGGHPALGANVEWFLRILAGNIFLDTLIGFNGIAVGSGIVPVAIIAVTLTALVLVCFAKMNVERRVLLAFSFLIFAAALTSPITNAPPPVWPRLARLDGIRYWFFPALAFAWTLIWCVADSRNTRWLRSAGAVLVLIMATAGVRRDWRHPPYADTPFASEAQAFDRAPKGTAMLFHQDPPGWDFRLVKR